MRYRYACVNATQPLCQKIIQMQNFYSEARNMTDSLIYSILHSIARASRVFARNPSDTNQTAVLLPNSVLLNLLVDGHCTAKQTV